MKKWLLVCLMFLVTFAGSLPSVQAASFKDMNKNKSSFYVEVNYLADRGIINGYRDGSFKPNAPIAKKHIAAMLVRALNLPTTNLKDPNYRDVPKTHPYYQDIAAAYTAGLFSDASHFKPESSISRAFMARLMSKAFNLRVQKGDNDFDGYSDVPRSSEFRADILKVSSNNIAKGYPDGTFKPNQLITRSHFAAFLTRALTVSKMNIMPDKKYTYYYTDGSSTYRYEYDRKDEFGLDYWHIRNETKYEAIPRLGFKQDNWAYFEAFDDWSHFDQYIPFPFVISQIHRDDDIGPVSYGNMWITGTNEVRTVRNVEYRDVLAVETHMPEQNYRITEYYAKDIGLIQRVDGSGRELFGLVKRVRK